MRGLIKKTFRAAVWLLLGGAVVVIVGAWWAYPKRSVDSPFVARAPFTFADIPRGRLLSGDEIDAFAHRFLAEMTLEEKVLQMSGDTWIWDFPGRRFVGREWKAGVDRRLALPRIVTTDGPRGIGLGHSTCFPVPMLRGASWDRSLEERIGRAASEEARAQGANMWLAPCLNVLHHPLWGRAQETYGEDPYLLGEMAAALTVGAQRNNVMACAKHYALNSIEETRDSVDVRIGERALREVYLPAFQRVVDAGAASVMSAYNKVNGDYCAENRHLLREILKDEWGFQGFVVSDWFQTGQDGVKSIEAGLDLEMPMTAVYGRKLLAAVQKGAVPVALVDDAVLRMLRRRIEYATRPDPMSYGQELVRSPGHVGLSREAAEKGVVLLENDAALLPLDARTLGSIAVVGPLADLPVIGDHGSSRVRPRHVVTLLRGLRDRLGDERVRYEPGLATGKDAPGEAIARVKAAAASADVAVVVAGFDYPDEGEYNPVPLTDHRDWGGDREHLALKTEDQQRILAVAAANPKTIVILLGGAAITVEEWRQKVGAILMAFYPGEEGGTALARVLCGDVNPSGKLPYTVPRTSSELPVFDDVSKTVEYGYYHGYMLADKRGFEPRYAFGYGLSYTSFEYARLSLDAREAKRDGFVHASVDVTNTGRRSGEEVVELYVGFPPTPVDRPVKVLRGFEKVALGPGETRRVTLTMRARDLAYYDTRGGRWIVEAGEYRVSMGSSSRASDLRSAELRIVD
jgi:beta-glucosidase